MTFVKMLLAATALLFLIACEYIPTHNIDHKPISIKADGQDYFTCDSYSLSNDGWFGNSSYSISFTNVDKTTVTLHGVKTLAITELPDTVDAPMPSYLPDIKTDHPSDAPSYVEGNSYKWPDGTQARIKNGRWVSVKQKNPMCNQ